MIWNREPGDAGLSIRPNAAFRTVLVVFAAMCVAVFGLGVATADAAPPDNDDFANASMLSGTSASASGTLTDATLETGEPFHEGLVSESVWYDWTAPSDGTVTISVSAIVVRAYTGSTVGSLTLVSRGEEDDHQTFDVVPGTTYRIAVAGASKFFPSGIFSLDLNLVPPPSPPPNDQFNNALTLSGSPTTASGTLKDATIEPGEPDQYMGFMTQSVWYNWTAKNAGKVTLSARQSVIIRVYTGSVVNDLTSRNNEPVGFASSSFQATAGTTYRIAVASNPGLFSITTFDVSLSSSRGLGRATPKVTIKRKPGKKTRARKATFRFRSSVAGSRFTCRIDDKAFSACRSPKTYKRLAKGSHTFKVKATAGGRSSSAVSYSWKVK